MTPISAPRILSAVEQTNQHVPVDIVARLVAVIGDYRDQSMFVIHRDGCTKAWTGTCSCVPILVHQPVDA